VIDDQWGAPTGAELLAAVTATAIGQVGLAGNEALAGLYHLAAGGETTWHQYASHVVGRAKALRPDLPWAVKDIAPVPSSAFVTAARRPHNSRLDTRKLQAAFGIHLPDWQQGVDEMLAQVLSSTPRKETS
jgi:dTDP-4-dehydrorhamnose reductase